MKSISSTIERSPMRVTRFKKSVRDSNGAVLPESLTPIKPTGSPAPWPHLVLCFTAFLFAFSTVPLHAQDTHHTPDYTSIVVFGDSLSDTGNVADLSEAKYGVRIPGPYADYTDGRFTDGADTEPAAENYFGVWVEQFAATLPAKPEIKASLDGGTDYAYGFAFTGDGTSVFSFGPSDELSVVVNNIGQQIADYLATHPKITDKTLFVVWGGANDLLNATSADDIIDAGINQTLNIQRLVDAGATQFIVPNLPPLGLVPRLNGSPTTSVPATKAAELYNQVLAGGIAVVRDFNRGKHLTLEQLDVFALFNQIIAAPKSYSLVNVTDSSQGMAVDPDTYLFWDDLHPTTRGHNILATTAAKIIAQSECGEHSDPAGLNDPHGDCAGEFAVDTSGAKH
jgi:outer membrane lipase/esterase